jgi:hypothetical protein
MPKLGAYSKEIVLARPDGRSREARLLKQMRASLFQHLGGEDRLSPPQRVLVERAAMLQLRVATLDEKVLGGTFSEYDAKTYLAFSNSLTRTMTALGLDPVAAAAIDPMAALRAHVSARQAGQAA